MIKPIIFCLLAGALTGASAALAGEDSLSRTEVREFAPGGSLEISLRAGDVKIERGSDDKHIRLRYSARSGHRSALDRVRLSLDVHALRATIAFEAPQGVDLDAVIEVPSPTALEIKMTAGDINIKGVEGNKALDLHVGDIEVVVGEKPDYWKVEAGTKIGDVNSSVFGEAKGSFLGNSLKYHGDGQYRLVAHVGVGDIAFKTR